MRADEAWSVPGVDPEASLASGADIEVCCGEAAEIAWPDTKVVAARDATINVQDVLIGAIRTRGRLDALKV